MDNFLKLPVLQMIVRSVTRADNGITLTLPDLSLLLQTTLSNRGEGGGVQWTTPLTHEPFDLTTSNLAGC